MQFIKIFSQMKQSFIIGLAFSVILASSFPCFGGTTSKEAEDNTPIIIRQDSTELPGAPRSNNPFFAELSNGYVILGASTSSGTVLVRITSTAGDDYSTYFNTSAGMILLPISGDPGDYLLSITTPDGIHYIGEFTI